MFIDQGYSLNALEWTFPDRPLRGVYVLNCVYAGVTGWETFEPALTKAEEGEILDVWRCAEQIPAEWYEHDQDSLNRIIETVFERRKSIRRLIDDFRKSSRNPFPNWTEN